YSLPLRRDVACMLRLFFRGEQVPMRQGHVLAGIPGCRIAQWPEWRTGSFPSNADGLARNALPLWQQNGEEGLLSRPKASRPLWRWSWSAVRGRHDRVRYEAV